MAATRTQVATYLNDEQLKYWEAVKSRYGDKDAEAIRNLIIEVGKKILSGEKDPVEERMDRIENQLLADMKELRQRIQQLENKTP